MLFTRSLKRNFFAMMMMEEPTPTFNHIIKERAESPPKRARVEQVEVSPDSNETSRQTTPEDKELLLEFLFKNNDEGVEREEEKEKEVLSEVLTEENSKEEQSETEESDTSTDVTRELSPGDGAAGIHPLSPSGVLTYPPFSPSQVIHLRSPSPPPDRAEFCMGSRSPSPPSPSKPIFLRLLPSKVEPSNAPLPELPDQPSLPSQPQDAEPNPSQIPLPSSPSPEPLPEPGIAAAVAVDLNLTVEQDLLDAFVSSDFSSAASSPTCGNDDENKDSDTAEDDTAPHCPQVTESLQPTEMASSSPSE